MPATASDRKRPGFTVRLKLTALYGALFLVSGAVLLTMIYLLVQNQLGQRLVASTNAVLIPGTAVPPSHVPLSDTDATAAIIAESAEAVTLETLLVVSLLSLVGVAAVSVAAGWWLSGRVLQPLHTITATAQRLSSTNLHERLALKGPQDELTELAETFDQMLDRLQSAFDSQRRFVANASHELRTPLAFQRAAIQIGLAGNPSPEKAAEIREQLLTANRRIERLIDGLLVLARSDRGLDKRTKVELHTVTADVVAHYHAEAQHRRVTVQVSLAHTEVLGEKVLLTQLVTNLVSNAIRHNLPEGGTVWIRTDPTHGLSVANTGTLVAHEQVPQLFEPFRRGEGRTDKGEGAGLGLSIVDSITRAHDGSVHAVPRPGGGLSVRVELPDC
ncbi:Signal transduction histidine kinase [Lentzea albidocapillata subsp. violacea]|uniref:histidine kinase n=1 Tax=Lentzea albidocapillata subsp. violacea TaxID=128104 RepID=A0A1G9NGP0_9PSEU|nr:HAMP domain-containing sensor histidine kinase [Lentzea albidocapillata]SDL85065.1 Signal transduction histidine kinase [Lentzea albidocapillata subsp. violacea]